MGSFVEKANSRLGNAWLDLAGVALFFSFLTFALLILALSTLICTAFALSFRSVSVGLPYWIMGLFSAWVFWRLFRIVFDVYKTRSTPSIKNPELFEVIPSSELGVYADHAFARLPKGWGLLEEAFLVRSPILTLRREIRGSGRLRLSVGLPILAGLSDEEARCFMTYLVARFVLPGRAIDCALGRLNVIAKTRMQLKTEKGLTIRSAVFWATLYRKTVKAVNRNERFARSQTALQCGDQLADQTFAQIAKIQKGWPIFEKAVLIPLVSMGGIPPVVESYRIWSATGGNLAAFASSRDSSRAPFSLEDRRFTSLVKYETRLYTKAAGRESLRPVAGQNAFLSLGPNFWEEQSQVLRYSLPGKRLRDLPELITTIGSLSEMVLHSSDGELPESERANKVFGQLVFACLTSLSKAGWVWQAPPLQPVILEKNGVQVCPQIWFQKLTDGSLSSLQFEMLLNEQGIDQVPLTLSPVGSSLVM